MRRFAAVYFVSFLTLGVYAPWLPPFLDARGMSPKVIALALGVVSFWRATLPPAWGLVADRLHRQHWLLAGTLALSGICLLPLTLPLSSALLLAALGAYGFFLAPALPLTEALTLSRLGSKRAQYGQVRLWGSLGFIAMSVGMGLVVDRFGLETVPWALALPMLIAGALCLTLPPRDVASTPPAVGASRRLPWRSLWPILLAAALGQASHSPYYAYFTLDLSEHGTAPNVIGVLWAIGVVAEVALLACSSRLFARIGPVTALRWGLALAGCRWLVLASTKSVALIALSQPLHAASYAVVHIATLQLVDDLTPAGSKALAQSVLSALVYGVGVGGGYVVAGELIAPLGYGGLYIGAAATCLVALFVSLRVSRRPA